MTPGRWPMPKNVLRQSKPGIGTWLGNYFFTHVQACLSSLGHLYRNPLATLMTTLTIGLSLSLPVGLYVLVDNLHRITSGINRSAHISVFLADSTGDVKARQLRQKIDELEEVQKAHYLSPQQVLNNLKQSSGLGELVKLLDENPLPALILVEPKLLSGKAPDKLLKQLQNLPGVEFVQQDVQWLNRLEAIIHTGNTVVWVMAILFTLSMLLILGNTLRLAVFNRREEIRVARLVGATNAFIRRPFLYFGICYGLAGGLIAWLSVYISFQMIDKSVRNLALLYDSEWSLFSIQWYFPLIIMLLASFTGWLGSRLSISQQLSQIEP